MALQGAVPGLTITRGSSRPGSEGLSMKIRGNVSVNDLNDKGIDTSSPLIIIDGMYCSLGELNAMEPNDIENISILKDASAAIYGARSSHGVVLVTTKKGKQGKAQVSYNGSFSTSIDGIKLPLTTNQQWMDMFYEAQYNDFAVQNPEQVGKLDANGNPVLEGIGGFWWILGTQANGTDGYLTGVNDETGVAYKNRRMWEALRNGETFTLNKSGQIQRFEPGHYAMNDLYGSAFSHKHNLSISGADEKFSYRASLGYAENNSQLKVAEDGEKRYSARLNMDYQASKMLKLESGMSYEKQNITTPSTDVGAGYYDFWVWPYYNEKGQFYDTFGNRNVIGGLVGGGQIKTENLRFRGNLKATFDLSQWIQGLSFSASGAYKFSQASMQTSKMQ